MTGIGRRDLLRGAGLALTVVPAVAQAAPSIKAMTGDGLGELHRRLQALTASALFSGAVLVADGDTPLFMGAYGLASMEYDRPNLPITRFNLASASKMFTAVAIAQLVEAGKLDYETTIERFVDDGWLAREHASRITIGQLLSHTAGLGSYFTPQFAQASRLSFRTLDDFKALVHTDRPAFEPGSNWSYSNSGYLLLGVIVERASDLGFDEVVASRILRPTGMERTGALDLDHVNTGYAQNYFKVPTTGAPPAPPPPGPPGRPLPFVPSQQRIPQVRSAEEQLVRSGFSWRNNIFEHVVRGGPAGAWYSTVEDMFRFMRAFARDELVTERTRRIMTSPKPGAPNWGYGFILEDGVYGHTGGFIGVSTSVTAHPSGKTVIILSNVSGGALIARGELAPLLGL